MNINENGIIFHTGLTFETKELVIVKGHSQYKKNFLKPSFGTRLIIEAKKYGNRSQKGNFNTARLIA